MRSDEYETMIAGLTASQQKVMAEARDGKPICAPKLKHDGIVTSNGGKQTLLSLAGMGLLRPIGKRDSGVPAEPGRKNPSSLHFTIVPLDGVEAAAEKFGKSRAARNGKPSAAMRLGQMPTRVHGDYEKWHRARTNMLRMTAALESQLPVMAFWNCVPEDELSRLIEELLELDGAVSEAFRLLLTRVEDDVTLDKIEKAGRRREGEESATADRLRRRLRQRRVVMDG